MARAKRTTRTQRITQFEGLTPEQIAEALSQFSNAELAELETEFTRVESIDYDNPLLGFRPTVAQVEPADCIKKILLILGGNASGKTVIGGKRAACFMLGYDPSETTTMKYPKVPTRGWAGSVDLKVGVNVTLREITKWLPKSEIQGFDRQTLTLKLKNGSSASLKSYDSDVTKWQSEPLDWIWFDEQPPYPHYMEGLSRVNRTGGYVWITMTPIYENSKWTKTHIYDQEGVDPEIACFIMSLDSNTYLPKSFRDRQRATYAGKLDEIARIEGRYVNLSGMLFPTFSKIHVIPTSYINLQELQSKGFEFARIFDSHPRVSDVGIWVAFSRVLRCAYIFDEFTTDMKVSAKIFANAAVAKHPTLNFGFNILDTPESDSEIQLGTSTRMEYSLAGLPCQKPFKNTSASIERTNEYMSCSPPGVYVTENCYNVRKALENASWDDWKGARRFEEGPKEKVRKFPLIHWVDVVRYFFYTVMPPLSAQYIPDEPTERAQQREQFLARNHHRRRAENTNHSANRV